MTYLVGQRETLRLEVKNGQGVLTDADAVLTLTKPDGTVSAPTVAKASTGVYTADVTYDQAGDWLRIWSTSGAIVSVDVDQIHVVAAALRIVGLAEVKEHGNITTTTTDRELLDFIGVAQQMIEGKIGAVVPATVSETHASVGSRLWLRRAPVLTVTSVTEYTGTTALTPLTSTGWVLDGEAGSLTRAYGAWAGDTVRVVYQAGRQPIPEAARWAAKELTIHLWRSTQALRGGRGRGAADADAATAGAGYGLPNRVEDALVAAGLIRAPVVA